MIALVELHTLGEFEFEAEGVRLLDGDDAVLADLVDRLGQHFADAVVGGRDGGHVGDLVLGVDFLGLLVDLGHGDLDGGLDASLEAHRVGAGGDVAEAFLDESLGQHGGGGGSVTGDVVGLGRNFLDQLGAHVLERVLQLDLTGDGHTVVGDGRGAELLVEHHVAALGAEGHLDGIGEFVHAGFEGPSGFLVEFQEFCHVSITSLCMSRGRLT